MKILYSNINLGNICDKKFTNIHPTKKQINVGIINDKKYIIKINENKNESIVTTDIAKQLKDQNFSIFFVTINSIVECKPNKYIYVMKEIALQELCYLLELFNKQTQITLLLQSLYAIFILNHKLGYFHNDLYYNSQIRNIMVDDCFGGNKIPDNKFMVGDVTIPLSNYCVKIIDFGWSSKEPKFRTTEYHDKYFKEIPFVSEILLFIYFYLKNINKDANIILNKIATNLSKRTQTTEEFDTLLIKMIYKIYNSII